MINNINIKSGLLNQLLGKRKIVFKDGINILYGDNGCGKSTLLKTIGDYCLIEHHIGVSKYSIWFKDSFQMNQHYTKLSDFTVDWDGCSCFMYSGIDIQDQHSNLGYEMSTGKRVKELDYKFIDNMKNNFSSGQTNLKIYEALLKLDFKNLNELDYTENDRYTRNSDYEKFLKSKTFTGKQTLLFDEIDSHLSIKNQMILHNEILPKLAEKFQIIMISHSLFCFNHDNLIDLDRTLDTNLKIAKNILN